MNLATIEKRMAKIQGNVGKQRDQLDDFISELESLKESCERSWDALQDARDALSEFV